MGSSGKRKTTFAKLARESKLRERRVAKEAKKAARKQASAEMQPVSAEMEQTSAEMQQASAEMQPGDEPAGNDSL
jgi:hypothetical protein